MSKILPKAKLKHYGLIVLAEEISKQHNIDYVVWLLVATFLQTYNEKEQTKQRNIQNAQLVKEHQES